jgi:hypothetical protein
LNKLLKDWYETNGLAYFPDAAGSDEEKRYMPAAPVDNVVKLFTAVSYEFP